MFYWLIHHKNMVVLPLVTIVESFAKKYFPNPKSMRYGDAEKTMIKTSHILLVQCKVRSSILNELFCGTDCITI